MIFWEISSLLNTMALMKNIYSVTWDIYDYLGNISKSHVVSEPRVVSEPHVVSEPQVATSALQLLNNEIFSVKT